MTSMREYYVYILASDSGTLYIGVTSDIQRRVYEHRFKVKPGFTSRYGVYRLVYAESCPEIVSAIRREKQLKKWSRSKKEDLIASMNPMWDDLAADWFEDNCP